MFKVAFQSVPAYLMDILSYMVGRKAVMVNTVEKMHKAQKVKEKCFEGNI